MNDKKTERPIWAWAIFILLALIGISLISYIGYAIEITPSEKNTAPVVKLINAFMAISNHEVKYSFLDIAGKFFSGSGATRKSVILGSAAALVGACTSNTATASVSIKKASNTEVQNGAHRKKRRS